MRGHCVCVDLRICSVWRTDGTLCSARRSVLICAPCSLSGQSSARLVFDMDSMLMSPHMETAGRDKTLSRDNGCEKDIVQAVYNEHRHAMETYANAIFFADWRGAPQKLCQTTCRMAGRQRCMRTRCQYRGSYSFARCGVVSM